jgi:tetratricopeptide (TPR) repeat protein
MPSQESIEIFSQAIDLMQGDADESTYRDAVALLLMAIESAGEPFPRAHSILASLCYDLKEFEQAERHANTALNYDSSEFTAQYIKTLMAADNMTWLKSPLAVLQAGAFSIGYAVTNTMTTQSRFKKEAGQLILIFKELCSEGIDGDEFVRYSQQLKGIADWISKNKVPMKEIMQSMYAVIVNAPMDTISCDDNVTLTEVKKIRLLAQGSARFGK